MLYSLPAQWLQHNTKKQQKRSQKQQKPLRRHNSQKPGIPKPQKPHKPQKPQRLRTSYKIHIVTKATKEYKSQWSQDSRKPQKLEKLYKSHTKPRSQTEQKNTRPKNIPAPKRYTWNNYNCFRTPTSKRSQSLMKFSWDSMFNFAKNEWTTIYWLVVEPPLWKIWKSVRMSIPNIWENKTCSKPPTSIGCDRTHLFFLDELTKKLAEGVP